MPVPSFRNVCIMAHGYMMYDGSRRSVGGIQSYVDALIQLLNPGCQKIDVIQPSDGGFCLSAGPGVRVIGVRGYGSPVGRFYAHHCAGKYDLTICTHLPWAKWCCGPRLVAIQHGIGWDGYGSVWRGLGGWLRKQHYKCIDMRAIRRGVWKGLCRVNKLICVDLNFPNWLRATYPTRNWEELVRYVPNFGDPVEEALIEKKLAEKKGRVTVLIARRFEKMRGLPMMASIVSEIYDDWPAAEFVFAGWGSQKDAIQDILKGKDRCAVVRLAPGAVAAANLQADIVVVPTLWSEGTSLSCIEGMCAGAAVVATSVGGLGNLVVPDYSGLLVAPRYEDIKRGLVRLLGDACLRTRLARNGYDMAKTAFSREAWSARMLQVLEEVNGEATTAAARRLAA